MSRAASKSEMGELSPGLSASDDLRLIPFSTENADAWDEFVRSSRNGTLFHERRFLAYHPPERFVDQSYIAMRGNRWIAVCPGAVRMRDGQRWWSSHPGSTYGGPIFSDGATIADVVAVLTALVSGLREAQFFGLEMRLSEQAFRRRPSDEIEFGLWRLGFERSAVELSTTIPLIDGYDTALARYRDDTRRSLRKAQKLGVTVEWSEDFATYWRILEQNLARHGAHPTHTHEEITRLRGLCGDRVRLAMAHVGDAAVAGVVIFIANDVTFHSFYIAQDYEYQQTRALGMVMDYLVRWGCESRYRYFNLGISTEDSGRVINWGLFTFKEGFGGAGYVRTTHRLVFG